MRFDGDAAQARSNGGDSMSKNMTRMILLLIIASLGVLPLGVSGTAEDSATAAQITACEAFAQFAAILAEVRGPLLEAWNAASGGLYGARLGTGYSNAQIAVNLLEGSASEWYAPLGNVEYPIGVRPRLEQLRGIDGEGECPSISYPFEGVSSALDPLLSSVRLASNALVPVLEGGLLTNDVYDAFLTAQVLLEYAHERIKTLLQYWGYEVWVSPGESIQAAIDGAQAGATIYIEPGIYRETLEITKSITLDGWSDEIPRSPDSNTVPRFAAVLEPVREQPGIFIYSTHERIDVVINGISITDATTGIVVLGASALRLEDSDILYCSIGLDAMGAALVEIDNCLLDQNGVGLRLAGSAECIVQSSRIKAGTDTLAGIQLLESSVSEFSDSFIRDNEGAGILAADNAKLAITDSYVTSNGGDGILVSGQASLQLRSASLSANAGFGIRAVGVDCALDNPMELPLSIGSIHGEGNFIASADVMLGNQLGAFCPQELGFLIEANSE